MTNREFEIRALTLKQWGIPQTYSLAELGSEKISAYGDYVSFQSHHFIAISPALNNVSDIYSTIEKMRKRQQSHATEGAHIVQTFALVGRRTAFWDKCSDFMYTTFIQLADYTGWTYDTLEKKIGEMMDKAAQGGQSKPKWALYYSYDFCDLVLFAADMDIKNFSDVLYSLALKRGNGLRNVRYTYTIYGFKADTLVNAFDGTAVLLPEPMSFVVNLSAYSASALKTLEDTLSDSEIKYEKTHIFGRYDICFKINDLDSAKTVLLLKSIDAAFDKGQPDNFGSYEIIPYTSPVPTRSNTGEPARTDKKLKCRLAELVGEDYLSVETYIKETVRSLEDLIDNGFSLEFVLSVFPSFAAMLRNLKKDEGERIEQREDSIQRYFNALNTLALSTMHGERRFIQAPAFSATYFDIPPKLLAFYSAMADLIARALNQLHDSPDDMDDYCFLLTPDYRTNINVIRVEPEEAPNVAIVYLMEKYFYAPIKVLYLLCHEIAHYVGARHRKKRAECILFTISSVMLLSTRLSLLVLAPNAEKKMVKCTSLLGLLSDELAKYLLQQFEEQQNQLEGQESEKYGLRRISNFLEEYEYGLGFFRDPYASKKITLLWAEKMASSEDVQTKRDIKDSLIALQDSFGTRYLSKAYSLEGSARKYACEALSANIVEQILDFATMTQKDSNYFERFCENILDLYREAYADIRLKELLGKAFDIEMYEELLEDTKKTFKSGKRDVTIDLELNLRHDALLELVKDKGDRKIHPYTGGDFELRVDYCAKYVAKERLVDYMKHCRADVKTSEAKRIEDAAKTFLCGSAEDQYLLVLKEIAAYKSALSESNEKEGN